MKRNAMSSRDPVMTCRVSQILLDDLDELMPLVQQLPEYRAATLTRSAIVRIALTQGVIALRRQLAERTDIPEQVDLLDLGNANK